MAQQPSPITLTEKGKIALEKMLEGPSDWIVNTGITSGLSAVPSPNIKFHLGTEKMQELLNYSLEDNTMDTLSMMKKELGALLERTRSTEEFKLSQHLIEEIQEIEQLKAYKNGQQ